VLDDGGYCGHAHMKKHVLITGSSSGIGKACAERLAAAGMVVVGGARRYVGRAHAFATSQNIACLELDLCDTDSIERFVDCSLSLATSTAGYDYAVLNAGSLWPGNWLDQTVSDDERTIAVNFSGHMQFLRALERRNCLRTMKSIVLIGSIYSRRAAAQILSYAAAKAALESATRSLAVELAPGTRVNCVLPGHIDTAMLASAGTDFVQEIVSRTPMRRVGLPEEIAQVVEFLLTSATFITGTAIVVDGGYQLS
jgi:NAD(P)-dependent dehydrogenase (short-subunit alcohol dehydrogenase family)